MNQELQKFQNDLRTKKVAVIGAGVSNMPLLNCLLQLGCDVTLFDQKTLEEMKEETREFLKNASLKFSLGKDYLEKLRGFDVIFRSPSFLPTNSYLQKEKERGALITSEIEQVIRLAPCKVIGVTGSKGKTTTTTILNSILIGMGYTTYLGGNIGIPLFDKLDQMKKEDIVVLELSSFQLMEITVSPDIAIVTNLSPDHLDVHRDYEEYVEAKKGIYQNQTKQGILVLNADDPLVVKFAKNAVGEVRYFKDMTHSQEHLDVLELGYYLKDSYIMYQDQKVIDTNKLLLKGRHNYLNICAALTAIHSLICCSVSELEKIIQNIHGVAHRLEFVQKINGVEWYNDSASTTPDKAIAGITAFSSNVVLIAGGYDKNIDYDSMAEPILKHVHKLILFGSTKNKIYDVVIQLCRKKGIAIPIYVMDTLEEVVEVAYQVSVPGEVVLFSPASASFDMFHNAYERGDLFKKLVQKLGD